MAKSDRARHMRILATGLLAAMAVSDGVARHFAAGNPAWGWLRAFSEAALVGGLADWFAVTALFRHPLGLPIPHTAIIPANRDRIADTMAQFLRSHFLTPAVVARRLRGLDWAARAGALLEGAARIGTVQPRGRITRELAALLREFLQSAEGDRLGAVLVSAARRGLAGIDVATLAGHTLRAAIAEKRHVPLIDAGLRWAGFTLADNEDVLRSMIHERANSLLRWTGLDERLANAVLDGAYRLIAQSLVDPDHPLRLRVEARLANLADDLIEDATLRATIARWQAELLADPAIADGLRRLWQSARAALLQAGDSALPARVSARLAGLGRALQQDTTRQQQLGRLARRVVVGITARYGAGIVALVSETVRSWDKRTIIERIESAVGRDLQFIRLNGTLVGGSVGLALYALDRLL